MHCAIVDGAIEVFSFQKREASNELRASVDMVLQKSREKQIRAIKHPSSNLAKPNNEKLLRQPQQSKKSPSRTSSGNPVTGPYIPNKPGYHSSTRRAYQGTPAWKPSMSPTGHVPGPPILEPNYINSLPDRSRGDTINIRHQIPALNDLISSKLDAIISSIDGETFSGDEQDLGNKLYFQAHGPAKESKQLYTKIPNSAVDGEDPQPENFPKAQIELHRRRSSAQTILLRRIYMRILDYHLSYLC